MLNKLFHWDFLRCYCENISDILYLIKSDISTHGDKNWLSKFEVSYSYSSKYAE